MLHLLIRIANDMKLRTKLFLSFIIVVFVPVLLIGVILTGELRREALGNALEQTSTNVERVKKRTSDVIGVSFDISYWLANDSRLETVVNTRYSSISDVVNAYKDYPDLRKYESLYNKELSSIRLYIDNPTLLNNWEFLQPTPDIQKTDWYREAMNGSNGAVSWRYIQDELDGRNYLSLIRKIDFLNAKSAGVLVINVNMNMLNEILKQETFDTMIVDDKNRVISANRPGLAGKTLEQLEFDSGVSGEQSGTFDAVVEGKASKVVIDQLAPEGSLNSIRIISVFSVGSIMATPNRLMTQATTVISISLIVAILLIFGFSTMLTKRILRLSKHITKVATGNLDTVIAIDGKDEIGQLSRQFNSMVTSINILIGEVQESDRQKRKLEAKQNEIKFKMMASQINPHFLFNALESIRMKAHLKGEKDIANVVRLLGKMMRRNIEVGSRTITLRSEIDMVRCYLDIQKFRYDSRLQYEMSIDPLTEHVLVLPLIIQPLVENAVIHGLENLEEGGCVKVKTELAGEYVRVEVSDNGEGMTKEKLDKLYQSLEDRDDEERNRIGMRNVHLRLKLSYGDEHGLSIWSEPGKGTKVYFTLPIGGGYLAVQSTGSR